MLFDSIMNGGVQFTYNGIKCATPEIAFRVFKFMREAVLDRHICITKAIGVKFTNNIRGGAITDGKVHIEGHYNCGESYPELMVNLQDKVYLVPPDTTTLTLNCNVGKVLVTEIMHKDAVLFTEPYMFRVLTDRMAVELTLNYGSGFHSMSRNSKVKSDMFPFYTNYSLDQFVRVLPMMYGETFIKMKYLNGMTVEKFYKIMQRWYEVVKARDVSKEDLLWLQSFGL